MKRPKLDILDDINMANPSWRAKNLFGKYETMITGQWNSALEEIYNAGKTLVEFDIKGNFNAAYKKHKLTEKEVFDEVMDSCNEYMGGVGANVKRYTEVNYPQRLVILNRLIFGNVLREQGDYNKYIKLTKALINLPERQPSYADLNVLRIVEWFKGTLDNLEPVETSRKPGIVINILAFGEEYIKKMSDYLFPSWCSEGNIKALSREYQVIINICTTEKYYGHMRRVLSASGFYDIEDIKFIITNIPDTLVGGKDEMYILLGACGSIGIAYAKHLKAAFHHSFPDVFYSNNFFSEIVRLAKKHKNILMPAHRTDESVIIPKLEAFRKNGVLSVPSDSLAAMGLQAFHICEWPNLMNNRPQVNAVPMAHKLYYETEDSFIMHSPHVNAAFLSAESVQGIPDRFFHTLDSELDMICRGNNFYLPQDDDLYMVEMSNQSSNGHDDRYLILSEYPRFFWQVVAHHDTLKFFHKGMKVKINRSMRPAINIISNEQHNIEIDAIYQSILSLDPYKGAHIKRSRLHDEAA